MTVLPELRVTRPATVAEAVAAWSADPDGRLVAGGTDLIVNLRRGLGSPPLLIDISGVAELKEITDTEDGGVRIGAGVTLQALAGDARLRRDWPVLVHAAESVAGPTHRVRATLGGNLCLDTRCVHYNESDWWRSGQDYCLKYRGDRCHVVPKNDRCYAAYSGDMAPALLVLGAEVEIVGPDGTRRLPLHGLYQEDGRTPLMLAPGELVTAVHVPPPGALRAGYEKVRGRNAVDFPMVGVAAALARDGDAVGLLRIAVTGTNSRPVLVEGLDAFHGRRLDDAALEGLVKTMRRQIAPLRTAVTAPRYRREVAGGVTMRLLNGLFYKE